MPSDLKASEQLPQPQQQQRKTSYSHLLPSPASTPSSRAGSPAPLPPDAHFAYSTQLVRHHEPDAIVDFGTAASHALDDLKHQVTSRFTAYDPVDGGSAPSSSSQGGPSAYPPAAHGSSGSGGYSHHPFAHTTSPLTPSAHFATQSIAQALSALSTSASQGLDAAKVPAIRELSGPNEFEVAAEDPVWKKFVGKFYEDPLILLLLASAAVSAVVGNYDDAASIIMAIIIVVTGTGFLALHVSLLSLMKLPHSRLRARAALRKVARSAQQARSPLLPSHPVPSRPFTPPFNIPSQSSILTGTAARAPSSPTSLCPAILSPFTRATGSPPTCA